MAVIEVEHLYKDYGHKRGVFDISFAIQRGEIFGFLGPNGAGKTTTIRHLLGFSRPQRGQTRVNGLDSWRFASRIQGVLGYLPGEMALPGDLTGLQFLHVMADLRGMKDLGRAPELMERFALDPSGRLKRMSKGMKQKVGIVCAFMHDPDILILDEPTSGLDPLMQNAFIELIEQEKAAGKTILMSSHMFEEVERTCDRIAIIKQGRLLDTLSPEAIRHTQRKIYKLELATAQAYERFVREPLDFIEQRPAQQQVKVEVEDVQINAFIRLLGGYELRFLTEVKRTLEDVFLHYYGGEEHVE